jgi:hypothetical protein
MESREGCPNKVPDYLVTDEAYLQGEEEEGEAEATVLTQKSQFENALNRDFQKRVLQPTLFKRPQLNA